MKIVINRFIRTDIVTLGTMTIDGIHEAFTLENPVRVDKLQDVTAIPVGVYEVKLRKSSPMSTNYGNRFKEHRGMLWLQNVQNYEWIYIHIGNEPKDTDGCILVGSSCEPLSNFIGGSVTAYRKLYKKILVALNYDTDERVWVEII